jgi:hypothetical protein
LANNSAILDGFIGLPTPVSRSRKRGMRQTRPWSAQCRMALGQGVTLAAKFDGVFRAGSHTYADRLAAHTRDRDRKANRFESRPGTGV